MTTKSKQKDRTSIWEQVSVTDPKYTKAGTGTGNKFTAINPTWLVKKATEVFGAAGEGWGTKIHSHEVIEGPVLDNNGTRGTVYVVLLSLWWRGEDGTKFETPAQFGQTHMVVKRKSGQIIMDDEAPKKAVTDAMNKCFSYLGFSADIFMGLWDDNKYVESAAATYAAEAVKKLPDLVAEYIAQLEGCNSGTEVRALWHLTSELRRTYPNEAIVVKLTDDITKKGKSFDVSDK